MKIARIPQKPMNVAILTQLQTTENQATNEETRKPKKNDERIRNTDDARLTITQRIPCQSTTTGPLTTAHDKPRKTTKKTRNI